MVRKSTMTAPHCSDSEILLKYSSFSCICWWNTWWPPRWRLNGYSGQLQFWSNCHLQRIVSSLCPVIVQRIHHFHTNYTNQHNSNISYSRETSKSQDVTQKRWKVMPAVEWLPWEHQLCFWRTQTGQRLHRYHLGMWRWSAGGDPQNGPHCI